MPSPQILLKQMDWMLSKPGWLPAYSLSLVQIGSKWSNNTTNDILGALFEYSVILLRMKIKTIRQIRKCLNGNLAAYLAPLANPLSSNVAVGNGINRQTQGTNPRNKYKYTFKLDLSEQKSTFFSDLHQQQVFWWNAVMSFFLHFDNLQTKWRKSFPIKKILKMFDTYWLICRRNFFSSLRSYLKGWLGISVLFSMSVLNFFNCLCHCFLFLSEKDVNVESELINKYILL